MDCAFSQGCVGKRLVQGVLERFAGFECRDSCCSNLDRRAGLGIAARSRCSISNGKGSEANQRNRIRLLQRIGNRIDGRIQSSACSSLGDISGIGDSINQFGFVHILPLCDDEVPSRRIFLLIVPCEPEGSRVFIPTPQRACKACYPAANQSQCGLMGSSPSFPGRLLPTSPTLSGMSVPSSEAADVAFPSPRRIFGSGIRSRAISSTSSIHFNG